MSRQQVHKQVLAENPYTGMVVKLIMLASDRILKVDSQNNKLCIWYFTNADEKPNIEREFLVLGTGRDLPDGVYRYIGTTPVGPYNIWHVLEKDEK